MNWLEQLKFHPKTEAIQTVQFVWLASAIFALSLAIPGIPNYIEIDRPFFVAHLRVDLTAHCHRQHDLSVP